jgi:hypothetical protein
VGAVTVVAPTGHLKTQWADAAAGVGIQLNPAFSNAAGVQSDDYDGVALTYAQVASRPHLHRRRTDRTPTLVILDEIHHGGDARSWGDGIREAFEGAARRLALTGTPFRSDTSPIPFVRYEPGEDGILRSASDCRYGCAAALRDGVVRPVLFLAYGGAMRWRTRAGGRGGHPARRAHDPGPDGTGLAHGPRPRGDWVPSVPVILGHAAAMEEERDHALDRPTSDEGEDSLWAEEDALVAAANRTDRAIGLEEASYEALGSDAHFDHVVFDAQQFGLHTSSARRRSRTT